MASIKGRNGTADKAAVSVADGRIIQLPEEGDPADRCPETIMKKFFKSLEIWLKSLLFRPSRGIIINTNLKVSHFK